MSLSFYNPFDLDNFSDFPPRPLQLKGFNIGPVHRWDETSDHSARLSIDVPGVKAQDMKVEVVDNSLRVSGERKDAGSESKFSKMFTIDPSLFDVSKIKANLDNGVLTLTMPKHAKEEPRAHTIAITEGTDTQ